MSDPLRTDAAHPAAASTDADKDARIEQLLLAGLDHYFAGQYDQAINVWTRVVFLERGHSRARAYIERARGALAERHRESDELLHRGIAAFNSGDTAAARDLITRALETGGPQDVALVLLERLNRLSAPTASGDVPRPTGGQGGVPASMRVAVRVDRSPWVRVGVGAAAVLAVLAGVLALAVLSGAPMPDWLADPAGRPQEPVRALPPDPLPIARASERVVARARTLQAQGEVRQALRLLDGVSVVDPMRPEADRLRGELQEMLLAAAGRGVARGDAAR